MSSENNLSSRESFIVRLWRESDSKRSWRGQIQHVSTGHITYIQEFSELEEYFKEYLEEILSKKNGIR